jgi:hypothetical protein
MGTLTRVLTSYRLHTALRSALWIEVWAWRIGYGLGSDLHQLVAHVVR